MNSVPKAISRLKELRSLVLQNNQIKSIDKSAFSENVNLESIDIKESSIDSLNYNAFSNLTNLRKLWVFLLAMGQKVSGKNYFEFGFGSVT